MESVKRPLTVFQEASRRRTPSTSPADRRWRSKRRKDSTSTRHRLSPPIRFAQRRLSTRDRCALPKATFPPKQNSRSGPSRRASPGGEYGGEPPPAADSTQTRSEYCSPYHCRRSRHCRIQLPVSKWSPRRSRCPDRYCRYRSWLQRRSRAAEASRIGEDSLQFQRESGERIHGEHAERETKLGFLERTRRI